LIGYLRDVRRAREFAGREPERRGSSRSASSRSAIPGIRGIASIYLLVDVSVIAVCGVLCGCDGPTAVHRRAVLRREWLERHFALPNGVPSRDCIRRLLLGLKPEAFQRCFHTWLADVQDADATCDEKADGRLVAIDGKTCRGSKWTSPRIAGAWVGA
jgi:hypothetical protein